MVSRSRAGAAVIAVALLVVNAAGCAPSPADAFRAFSNALARGDLDAAATHVTERSRSLLRGMHAAAGPQADPWLTVPADPDPLQIAEVNTTAERAELFVTAKGRALPVTLRREAGAWRVDLLECERQWSRMRYVESATALPPPAPGASK